MYIYICIFIYTYIVITISVVCIVFTTHIISYNFMGITLPQDPKIQNRTQKTLRMTLHKVTQFIYVTYDMIDLGNITLSKMRTAELLYMQ